MALVALMVEALDLAHAMQHQPADVGAFEVGQATGKIDGLRDEAGEGPPAATLAPVTPAAVPASRVSDRIDIGFADASSGNSRLVAEFETEAAMEIGVGHGLSTAAANGLNIGGLGELGAVVQHHFAGNKRPLSHGGVW